MISIIIPIYNEEEMLQRYEYEFYPEIEALKRKHGIDIEIVMVDDGSTDGSLDIMRWFFHNRDDTNVIHQNNQGMGAALNNGMLHSNGKLIVFMDADLTFRPSDIGILIEGYKINPSDCISGSPYLYGGLMSEVEPFRAVLSKGVNILYRILLQSNVTSISPIFRMYRRSVFYEIDIESKDFEVNAEILAKMIFNNLTVKEVPVTLHERKLGDSKVDIVKSTKRHLSVLYKIFRVKYLNKPWGYN